MSAMRHRDVVDDSNSCSVAVSPLASTTTSSAAVTVLTNPALLALVTQLQCGVSWRLHILVKEFRERYTNAYDRNIGLLWLSALRCGDLADVQLLYRMRTMPEHADSEHMAMSNLPETAARYGRVDVLQWLHTSDAEPLWWSTSMLYSAVLCNQYTVARWLMAHRPESCTANQNVCAASVAIAGDLAMLQELIAFSPQALTHHVMDAASGEAQWNVLTYLHEHSPAGCSTLAMDMAASSGHLDVVQFLHEHRTEGCTTKAINYAAENGHLDVIRFLCENRSEGFTDDAIRNATVRGHTHVVAYLHEQRGL